VQLIHYNGIPVMRVSGRRADSKDNWHPVGFIQPVARLAAGISLMRRFRLSPAILVGLTAFTAIFPLLWQRYWTLHDRQPDSHGPLSSLALADLIVLVLITRYVLALRSRGILR
jgi:hypothetical protein